MEFSLASMSMRFFMASCLSVIIRGWHKGVATHWTSNLLPGIVIACYNWSTPLIYDEHGVDIITLRISEIGMQIIFGP